MDHETTEAIRRAVEEGLKGFRGEMAAEFASVRGELAEVRRHVNVVGEQLRSDIRLVAEGLQGHREETAQEFKTVRDDISETRVMIRLAFDDLDRRIQRQ